jgi:hypothetical protein
MLEVPPALSLPQPPEKHNEPRCRGELRDRRNRLGTLPQPKISLRAASEMATAAGCRNFRSTVIA